MTAVYLAIAAGVLSIVYGIWATMSVMSADAGNSRMQEIAGYIQEGAQAYLTRQYTAEQALQMGLVNAVVPDEDLDAEVDRWCEEILRNSPQGLRLAKIALNASTDLLHGAVQHGLELVALNHIHGPEPKEGIASFQEKRKPDWRKFRNDQGPAPSA